MKKAAPKRFIKVVVSDTAKTSAPDVNGKKMNC
jgi:hypothetical protein